MQQFNPAIHQTVTIGYWADEPYDSSFYPIASFNTHMVSMLLDTYTSMVKECYKTAKRDIGDNVVMLAHHDLENKINPDIDSRNEIELTFDDLPPLNLSKADCEMLVARLDEYPHPDDDEWARYHLESGEHIDCNFYLKENNDGSFEQTITAYRVVDNETLTTKDEDMFKVKFKLNQDGKTYTVLGFD